ncbi:hypothetical protein [Dyadobacter bucti]|uniref:hypothetical protein n=1 Tax=Dyadobacter bucti TaxID=2572203 RepID=UPI0011094271|nr:hypothetical protein [Dyadobacter bucti]
MTRHAVIRLSLFFVVRTKKLWRLRKKVDAAHRFFYFGELSHHHRSFWLSSLTTKKGDLMMTSDETIDNPSAPASHKILLRWFPNVNQSAVFDRIGLGWECDQAGIIRIRFLVLDSVANALVEEVPIEISPAMNGIQKFLSSAEQREKPSHVVKMRDTIIGIGWKIEFNQNLNLRLLVMGQIVHLVIVKF